MNFDLFQWLSIISFLLSFYLSISKIIESRTKVSVDVLDSYDFLDDRIYLKVSFHNHSSNPLVISRVELSNPDKNLNTTSTTFEDIMFYFNNGRRLKTKNIPINLSPKNAIAYFFSFPVKDSDLKEYTSGDLILNVKINGKYHPHKFNFISKRSPETQLLKES